MKEIGNNYYAFLLRLWRENDASPWRSSLQDSRTGEKVGFANLGQLSSYLEDKTAGRLVDLSIPDHD